MNQIEIAISFDYGASSIGRVSKRFVPAVPRIGDFIYVHGEEPCYIVSEIGYHFYDEEKCEVLVWVKEFKGYDVAL